MLFSRGGVRRRPWRYGAIKMRATSATMKANLYLVLSHSVVAKQIRAAGIAFACEDVVQPVLSREHVLQKMARTSVARLFSAEYGI